jgi:sulfotransferase 6B1
VTQEMLSSRMYYVMHKFQTDVFYPYLSRCHCQLDRYKAVIEGFQDGPYYRPGIKEWYERFMKWSKDERALVTRFEDLNGENRTKECERMINYLFPAITSKSVVRSLAEGMKANVKPEKSLTFRKGKTGGWRDEFDEELINLTKNHAGQLLIDLGYETKAGWQ